MSPRHLYIVKETVCWIKQKILYTIEGETLGGGVGYWPPYSRFSQFTQEFKLQFLFPSHSFRWWVDTQTEQNLQTYVDTC
jgi:hypothetical protein